MKKNLLIAVVALSLAGFAVGLEVKPAGPESTMETIAAPDLCPAAMQARVVTSAPGKLGQLPWEVQTSWWLSACDAVDGFSCPVVGDSISCLQIPFEVKTCVCQNNNTWSCS